MSACPRPPPGQPLRIAVENRHSVQRPEGNPLRLVAGRPPREPPPPARPRAPRASWRSPSRPRAAGRTLELKAYNSEGLMLDAWRIAVGARQAAEDRDHAPAEPRQKVELVKGQDRFTVRCGDDRLGDRRAQRHDRLGDGGGQRKLRPRPDAHGPAAERRELQHHHRRPDARPSNGRPKLEEWVKIAQGPHLPLHAVESDFGPGKRGRRRRRGHRRRASTRKPRGSLSCGLPATASCASIMTSS